MKQLCTPRLPASVMKTWRLIRLPALQASLCELLWSNVSVTVMGKSAAAAPLSCGHIDDPGPQVDFGLSIPHAAFASSLSGHTVHTLNWTVHAHGPYTGMHQFRQPKTAVIINIGVWYNVGQAKNLKLGHTVSNRALTYRTPTPLIRARRGVCHV